MASYHCSVKYAKQGMFSAKAHADYICREGKYAKGDKAEELVYKEHGNMPEWAKDNPQDFWKASDQYEIAGARVYTEFEIDLPNELTREQKKELVAEFVKEHVGEGKAYTYAIHEKNATLDPNHKNPHAHIMFCERKNDGIERTPEQFFKRANTKNPERGGAKKDDRFTANNGVGKQNVTKIREAWANHQNKYLEKYGHEARVDHRKLEAQRKDALERGDKEKAELLDRPPEKHLGPKVAQRFKRDYKKHMEKGKTPEERQSLRKDYLKYEKNDKVIYLAGVRQLKQITQEINKLESEQKSKGIKQEQGQEMTIGNIGKTASAYRDKLTEQLRTERDPDKRKQLIKQREALSKITKNTVLLSQKKKEQTIKIDGPLTAENLSQKSSDIINKIDQKVGKELGRERGGLER